ncbi:TRAP transporter small permease subunit [Paracoccus sp. YLB-12]|uniref:TRAP transporter small permease protein n=1 Tax=Paracoccus maritimus TaxID=2933292 RepID=A0ABT2K6T0_9RHOB|nr:TRAP transporter small permease subunit [Paracoccus sp. YLB-12]MCT4332198.1 TRAP transporter small permease subunit [Paracoccus sp. YLB-12]
MGSLLALSRGIDRINTLIGRTASWLILLAIFVSAVNAVVRKVFSVSSNAWLELQWYLYGGAFLLAAAYTLLENEHIRIDVIYGRWSRRVQHWIDLVGTTLFLLPFSAIMISLVYPSLMSSWRAHEISMNAGGLLIWPAKAVLLAGFVLLFAQGLSELVKKIAVMRGVIPDPHAPAGTHDSALHEARLMTVGTAPDHSRDDISDDRENRA